MNICFASILKFYKNNKQKNQKISKQTNKTPKPARQLAQKELSFPLHREGNEDEGGQVTESILLVFLWNTFSF
jgi:hypothetical protein